MKIALVTIHNVTNYGAILQAYATKIALSKYGEVTVVDYQNQYLNKNMHKVRFEASVHGIKMLVHDLLNLLWRTRLLSRFKHFTDTNLNLTATLGDKDLLEGKLGKFDIYVCGSDQIWNPVVVSPIDKIDPIFFLSFAPDEAKKFSYASSIGHHYFTQEEKQQVQSLLDNFDMISVRESDGKKKLEELLPDKKIFHVVDPTLILPKKEWFSLFNVQQNNEKYILVYSVPRTELIKKAIGYFSQKMGLKIVAIDRMFFPIGKIDKHVRDAGPNEFIQLFANASFIITDSFHGSCFSVNFEKPFACISANKGANRQESLLRLLNIDNRIMYKEEDFESLDLEVDYDEVTPKLEKIRNESLSFIEAAIKV
ncbi:polysaccharide pyruvyl transferase family protein [Euzebyella marina]|uniref:Polysaccharide pyruvyl transferase family protein n=1 Tax=Euzebyella marina TaxID=1761453 RepID=A0A3G2L1G7_9FLAO|nr:polysaccharide pyruvyl transferase family protein [Euzebyella marina]AYN66093.1 polysaccharide pyruvyl transferase family protein [Euzebyella marina]